MTTATTPLLLSLATPLIMVYVATASVPAAETTGSAPNDDDTSVIDEVGSDARAFYFYNGTAMVNTTTVAITLAYYSVIALGIYSLIANAANEQMATFIDGGLSINRTAEAFKAVTGLLIDGIDRKDENFAGGSNTLHLTPDRPHRDYDDYHYYSDDEVNAEEDRYRQEYQEYLKQYNAWANKYGGGAVPPPQPPAVDQRRPQSNGFQRTRLKR